MHPIGLILLAAIPCGIFGYLLALHHRRIRLLNPDKARVQTITIRIRLNKPVPGSIALQVAADIRDELDAAGIPVNDPRVSPGELFAESINVHF